MSRLMTGILLVALLGLTAGMAWAQRATNGTEGFGESKYTAPGNPPAYNDPLPDPLQNGFPVAAEATFKATVLNYGQVSITPPADLTIPGDAAGVAGEDSIAWDSPDAGLIEVQANTTCTMAIEVTEFRGDTVAEDIWTEIALGLLEGKNYGKNYDVDPLGWYLLEDYPTDLGWQRISTYPGWYDFSQTTVAAGTRGTIIATRTLDPILDVSRYYQVPFGVKAKNRTFEPRAGRSGGYDTLALAQDYTATMWVTLTKP